MCVDMGGGGFTLSGKGGSHGVHEKGGSQGGSQKVHLNPVNTPGYGPVI